MTPELARSLAVAAWLVAAVTLAQEPQVSVTQTSTQCMPREWERQLWPHPEDVRFTATTLEERGVFSRVLPALLAAAPAGGAAEPQVAADLETVGFLLETWRTPNDTFWVLRERPELRRGAGAYVIRTGPASSDFVQTPHAYFDSGTGVLGAQLFACPPPGTRPRLFATNTAHRFKSRPGETREEPDHPADLAHNPDHLFQWVTDLAARGLPKLRVLQLHGFASTGSRKELLAVVSAGSHRPSPAVRKLSGKLGTLLGSGVRLFPDQTDVFGATQNVQARLLQSYPGTAFVHLELSSEVRKSLASPAELARLGDALLLPFEG
ncbi:MAG: hypothetical protein M3Y59_12170 [Myxococcota bacterium]|nr:hypothetical protein [Myxococcota bacterium]